MSTQHIDVNNTAPTPHGAMSPLEKRMAYRKLEISKEEKTKGKKAKPVVAAKAVKTKKSAAPTKKEATKAVPSGKIELKTICKQINMDPKMARRILRKAELAFHDQKDRWAFTEKQAETVLGILSK